MASSHYLESAKDGSFSWGGALEQPRGMEASVGGGASLSGRAGKVLRGSLSRRALPQQRCQSYASLGPNLLTPFSPLLCLCRAVPAWLTCCNPRRCYSVSVI